MWANPSTNVPARWEGGGGGGAAGGARGGAAGPEGRRGVERGTGNGAARGQQTGLEARFNDVMARTPAVDSTMLVRARHGSCCCVHVRRCVFASLPCPVLPTGVTLTSQTATPALCCPVDADGELGS